MDNEETEPVTPPEAGQANPNELDEILKGYTRINVTPEKTEAIPGNDMFNIKPTEPAAAPFTPGPDAYYKTGKKAGQLKPSAAKKIQTPEMTVSGELLSGALFITLIDLVIPNVIAGINNLASKTKIDSEKLQLSEKQKKAIEPYANETVKRLNITANPVAIFCVSMVGMYGVQFMALKALAKEERK